eukprot:Skav222625  [mRNA]  locus=scaffold10:14769:26685:+ [translate_table: standard]
MLLRAISKTNEATALDLALRCDDHVLNARCLGSGATALHHAAAAGYAELCWQLLEMPNFFAVDDQDSQGCTALHYAASKGHLEACHVLLEHERFTAHNTQDWNGWTALHAAAAHGRKETLRELGWGWLGEVRGAGGRCCRQVLSAGAVGRCCRQELLEHEAYVNQSHVDHFGRTVQGLQRYQAAAPAQRTQAPKPKPKPQASREASASQASASAAKRKASLTSLHGNADAENQEDEEGGLDGGGTRIAADGRALVIHGGCASKMPRKGSSQSAQSGLAEPGDSLYRGWDGDDASRSPGGRKARPNRRGVDTYGQAVNGAVGDGEEGVELEDDVDREDGQETGAAAGSVRGGVRKVRPNRRGVDMYGQAVNGAVGEGEEGVELEDDVDREDGQETGAAAGSVRGGVRKVRPNRRGLDMYGQAVNGAVGEGEEGVELEDDVDREDGQETGAATGSVQEDGLGPDGGAVRKVRVDMYGQAVNVAAGEVDEGAELEDDGHGKGYAAEPGSEVAWLQLWIHAVDQISKLGKSAIFLRNDSVAAGSVRGGVRKVRPNRPGADVYGQAVNGAVGEEGAEELVEDGRGKAEGVDAFDEKNAPAAVEGDGGPDGVGKVRPDHPGAEVYGQAVNAAGAGHQGANESADGAGAGREKEVVVAWLRDCFLRGDGWPETIGKPLVPVVKSSAILLDAQLVGWHTLLGCSLVLIHAPCYPPEIDDQEVSKGMMALVSKSS